MGRAACGAAWRGPAHGASIHSPVSFCSAALLRRMIFCGYLSGSYDGQLSGRGSVERQVMNQVVGRTGGRHRGKAWCNFRPERVHWARYMGRSHRGRRTIERRAESWVRRHAAMPRAERPAVWAGLMAVEAGE